MHSFNIVLIAAVMKKLLVLAFLFGFTLPWVPEVFFSLGATELSGEAAKESREAAKESREAARKKPLAPTDNNLTSMPTPVSFDCHIRRQSLF